MEFLVPEKGRGTNKPYSLPQWGINAQPLRYLDFLADNPIVLNAEGLTIRLPHPAAYALHKFIVFKRRGKMDKHDKDLEDATRLFSTLLENNEHETIRTIFKTMHNSWQKTVIENLKSVKEFEIVDVLITQ